MDKIRVKNLRSLKDSGDVEISPLTILVGKNSIGKSTFLRMFQLLKQSVQTNRSEPILWYTQDLVDFGNFKDSIRDHNLENEMSFGFSFELPEHLIYREMQMYSLYSRALKSTINYDVSRTNFKDTREEQNQKIDVSFTLKENKISNMRIKLYDYDINIEIDKADSFGQAKIKNFYVNDEEKYSEQNLITNIGHFVNTIFFPRIRVKSDENVKMRESFEGNTFDLIVKKMMKLKRGQTTEKSIKEICRSMPLTSKEEFDNWFLKTIGEKKTMLTSFNKFTSDEQDKLIQDLYSLKGTLNINVFFEVVNEYLTRYFSNVQYIAPIRATASRYYRMQGLSVADINPQGDNIHMILANMTTTHKKKWKEWTQKNFGLQFEVSSLESNVSITVIDGEKKANLADTGFGYSQILPILLYVWRLYDMPTKGSKYYRKRYGKEKVTLLIEQPELHLHPALQGKVIDIFMETIYKLRDDFDFSIIMETHSEAMISAVGQKIIMDEKVSKDDVSILLFEEGKDGAKIQKAEYTNEGFLKNWPIGFFLPGGLN